MAATAAALAASLSSLTLSSATTSSTISRRRTLRRFPFPRASASSAAGPPREFNITFGAARTAEAPKSSEEAGTAPAPAPLLIPWIIRDENGGFKLSATPPAKYIHAMAHAKTAEKTKKKKGEEKGGAEPKHSKAARRFYNENFREAQRLSKVLAAAGVASRRSSEELIFEGRVTVNGSVCKSPQTQVHLHRDIIYVNGNRLSKKLPPKLYFALNKPKGYICSSGKDESKSVISLFDEYWKSWNKANPGLPKPRLFTVGRLDVATTGLIIVTNDGDFAQRLAHPSSGLTKEYIATIAGSVDKRQLIAVSEGVEIDGVHCVPESVELLPPQPGIPRPRIRVVNAEMQLEKLHLLMSETEKISCQVNEGRNHEVRELVKYAGLQLHSLKRIRIGGFRLPADLGLGQYIELKQAQLKSFAGSIAKVS